ncbi:MAG: hypothetical protein IIA14_13450 [SAR324 cluster bacterium]|nr:hypothetical protein [SAR324 cluster bacterium]
MKEFAKVYLKATGKRDNHPQGHFPYIGSGEGTIEGDSISGKIDWTLFEDQSKAPCDANLIGTITTDDGATIEFEALGFFKQDGDSKMYTLTSGIRFPTDDGRYSNLRENLGLMTGKGDVEVFEMKHRIFLSE